MIELVTPYEQLLELSLVNYARQKERFELVIQSKKDELRELLKHIRSLQIELNIIEKSIQYTSDTLMVHIELCDDGIEIDTRKLRGEPE